MTLLKKALAFAIILNMVNGPVQARFISNAEKAHIDRFLEENELNRYGDPVGTMYMGGTPLFDEVTGQVIDRYEYIIRNHPRILEDFVGVLPIDAARTVESSISSLQGSIRGKGLSDDFLGSLVNLEAENAILLDALRQAIDAGEFAQIRDLLRSLEGMDDQRLRYFSGVLRDVRRMLQMPTIQPVDLTEILAELRTMLDNLETRARA